MTDNNVKPQQNPAKNDPNKDANTMGGPSFHPNVGVPPKDENAAAVERNKKEADTALLDQEQVPPL